MSTRNKYLTAVLVLLVLIGGGAALGRRGPPVIALTNESKEEISKAYFLDARAAFVIERIQPHSTVRFIPEIKRDSDMNIWIDRNKETHSASERTHFGATGGYCVAVAVRPDLSIITEAHANCFSMTRLNPFVKKTPDMIGDKLTQAKCQDLGGRIAGEEDLKCTENEVSRGKVQGMMCPWICCVPKESQSEK